MPFWRPQWQSGSWGQPQLLWTLTTESEPEPPRAPLMITGCRQGCGAPTMRPSTSRPVPTSLGTAALPARGTALPWVVLSRPRAGEVSGLGSGPTGQADLVICGGLGGQPRQAHPGSAADLWVVLSKMLLAPGSVCFLVSIDSAPLCTFYFHKSSCFPKICLGLNEIQFFSCFLTW